MPAPTKQLNLICVDDAGASETFRLPVGLATGEEVLLDLQSRRESFSKAMDPGRLQHLRVKSGAFIDLKEPLLDQLLETETDLEVFQQLPPEAKGEQRRTEDPVFAKVHQRYDPQENQELQAELGQGLLDYGGRNGWRFCKNQVTGEKGFVPEWVFEPRPFGAVERIEAMTGKYVENLIFHMRDGSRRFYGTAGGDRRFSEDLEEDEAIVRVTQEILEGDEWVRFQVKTTRRELVINSLESATGRLQKPSRRVTVESKSQRQIRTLKFLDKTLVGCQHKRLHPRYIKRCEKRRRYLQRKAQEGRSTSPKTSMMSPSTKSSERLLREKTGTRWQ